MADEHDRRQQELLAACWDNYDNDAPRLAYADWLDTIGDPADSARAECIRLSVELVSAAGPRYTDALQRIAALIKKHKSAWFAGLPKELGDRGPPQMIRGLFEQYVSLTPRQLQDSGDRWFRRCPPDLAFNVTLQPEPPRKAAKLPPLDWSVLMGKPWWDRVLRLMVWQQPFGDEGCKGLAANPAFRWLRELNLNETGIGDEGGLALAGSPHLRNLRVLILGRCDLSGASAVPLAERANMPRLQNLFLGGNPRIDDAWDVIRRRGGASTQANFSPYGIVGNASDYGDLPPAGADDIPF